MLYVMVLIVSGYRTKDGTCALMLGVLLCLPYVQTTQRLRQPIFLTIVLWYD